ncbi:HWE histidine kinase domain-containing protein [Rhizobium sp. 0TCS1.26]|uniref:sensor histidine kinase n=1 Tax=Rhizobium sp. 0TCS1.26 TaxID=3142623 RepID=UPI003D2A0613
MATDGGTGVSGLAKVDAGSPALDVEIGEGRLSALLARLPAFRSMVQAQTPRQRLTSYAISLAIGLTAIAVRFVVDPYLPPGFPYLTFFPAIILTGFFFGIRPAIISSIICGCVAWYWFIPPAGSFALNGQSVTALGFYFFVVAIDLGLLHLLLKGYGAQVRMREDLTRHMQMQQVVSEEVDHRLKNLLATTSGLITLSQRHATTPEQLGRQLRQRIQAMGHSVALLRGSLHGGSADMRQAVLSALEPLGLTEGDRLAFDGPKIELKGAMIISLSLILHELGTNALKYGALTREGGSIRIAWRHARPAAAADDEGPMIAFVWEERGGPVVSVPTTQGFGTELVRRMASSFGTSVFDYSPAGLTVSLDMRAALVQA